MEDLTNWEMLENSILEEIAKLSNNDNIDKLYNLPKSAGSGLMENVEARMSHLPPVDVDDPAAFMQVVMNNKKAVVSNSSEVAKLVKSTNKGNLFYLPNKPNITISSQLPNSTKPANSNQLPDSPKIGKIYQTGQRRRIRARLEGYPKDILEEYGDRLINTLTVEIVDDQNAKVLRGMGAADQGLAGTEHAPARIRLMKHTWETLPKEYVIPVVSWGSYLEEVTEDTKLSAEEKPTRCEMCGKRAYKGKREIRQCAVCGRWLCYSLTPSNTLRHGGDCWGDSGSENFCEFCLEQEPWLQDLMKDAKHVPVFRVYDQPPHIFRVSDAARERMEKTGNLPEITKLVDPGSMENITSLEDPTMEEITNPDLTSADLSDSQNTDLEQISNSANREKAGRLYRTLYGEGGEGLHELWKLKKFHSIKFSKSHLNTFEKEKVINLDKKETAKDMSTEAILERISKIGDEAKEAAFEYKPVEKERERLIDPKNPPLKKSDLEKYVRDFVTKKREFAPDVMMLLTSGNSKLDPMFGIWSLPCQATCPMKTEFCAEHCYAKKAWSQYEDVREKQIKSFVKSKTDDPDKFVSDMIEAINSSGKEVIRIHESGDFYSPEYLEMWKRIAEACEQVTFMAYTKLFPTHKYKDMLKDMPPNFLTKMSLEPYTQERVIPKKRTEDPSKYRRLTPEEKAEMDVTWETPRKTRMVEKFKGSQPAKLKHLDKYDGGAFIVPAGWSIKDVIDNLGLEINPNEVYMCPGECGNPSDGKCCYCYLNRQERAIAYPGHPDGHVSFHIH